MAAMSGPMGMQVVHWDKAHNSEGPSLGCSCGTQLPNTPPVPKNYNREGGRGTEIIHVSRIVLTPLSTAAGKRRLACYASVKARTSAGVNL